MIILCPYKAEAKLLSAVMPDCHEVSGGWDFRGGKLIFWNGSGKEPLLAALSKISDVQQENIVLFGCAGALAPELKVGGIFSCSSIKTLNKSEPELLLPIRPGFESISALTVDAPVVSGPEREQLYTGYNAGLADMESYHFVRYFAERGRSLENIAVIRFISDTAEKPFTMKFDQSVRQAVSAHRKPLMEIAR